MLLDDADIRRRLKARTQETSIAEVARELDAAPTLISMFLSGGRDLGKPLAKKLGLKRVVRYVRTARARI